MSTIYEIPALTNQTGDTIYPPTSDTVWGSHVSHWGAGGYMEVPTQAELYGIPINTYLEANTYLSGRRKVGMIVYVIELDKFFQLRPRDKTTADYLTLAQYDALTPEEEKLVVLDPTASFSIRINGVRITISGSGNPADCWTELCLSCGNLEIIDVYASKTFTTEDANKIFHFHTGSSSNLTATVHTSCAAGFNLAVNNVGTGFLSLPGALGVSTVLDAQHSGAFMYKSASAVYAVGRL